jgi:hypothetical protein
MEKIWPPVRVGGLIDELQGPEPPKDHDRGRIGVNLFEAHDAVEIFHEGSTALL